MLCHYRSTYLCKWYSLVLSTLTPLLDTDPKRKCFRLIGGILVERTVTEVEPELRINTEGVSGLRRYLVLRCFTKRLRPLFAQDSVNARDLDQAVQDKTDRI